MVMKRVRRNDFRAFVHPPAAMVAGGVGAGLSVSYQRGGLLWNMVGLERMAQPARLEPA
jgi:magnesium-protoporphyrin O-methyltransferase